MIRAIYVATVLHATGHVQYCALTLDELFEQIATQYVQPRAGERPRFQAAAIEDACKNEQWQEALTIYFGDPNPDEIYVWSAVRLNDEIAERMELLMEGYPDAPVSAALDHLPEEQPEAKNARYALERWLRARDVTIEDLNHEPEVPELPEALPDFYPASLPPEVLGRQHPPLRLMTAND